MPPDRGRGAGALITERRARPYDRLPVLETYQQQERRRYLSSATMPPPPFFSLRAAFIFLVSRAFCIQLSAVLMEDSYSSLLSSKSARSRISRFSYDIASSYSGLICSVLSSDCRPELMVGSHLAFRSSLTFLSLN